MLFSDLIDYLKNEKTFNIILNCSTDLHEIRDVELLDGTQTGYATDIVYFGYPDVLSPDMQPSQCILVRGENYLFPYSCTDRATVQAKEPRLVLKNKKHPFCRTACQQKRAEQILGPAIAMSPQAQKKHKQGNKKYQPARIHDQGGKR